MTPQDVPIAYLPKHRTDVLRARRNDFAVVLNVLNEGKRLHRQLERMKPFDSVVDIIVSDAPSKDGSTEIERMRELGVTAVVSLTEPGRYSASALAAFGHAVHAGYEGVILMDGNGKDDPEALPRFIEALRAGHGFVQGSRFLTGGRSINTPRSRERLIRFVHAPVISALCFWRFTDTTNGFRAASRALLLDDRVNIFRPDFKGYDVVFYLPWSARRYGFTVAEIPVRFRWRLTGRLRPLSLLSGKQPCLWASFPRRCEARPC